MRDEHLNGRPFGSPTEVMVLTGYWGIRLQREPCSVFSRPMVQTGPGGVVVEPDDQVAVLNDRQLWADRPTPPAT